MLAARTAAQSMAKCWTSTAPTESASRKALSTSLLHKKIDTAPWMSATGSHQVKSRKRRRPVCFTSSQHCSRMDYNRDAEKFADAPRRPADGCHLRHLWGAYSCCGLGVPSLRLKSHPTKSPV